MFGTVGPRSWTWEKDIAEVDIATGGAQELTIAEAMASAPSESSNINQTWFVINAH